MRLCTVVVMAVILSSGCIGSERQAPATSTLSGTTVTSTVMLTTTTSTSTTSSTSTSTINLESCGGVCQSDGFVGGYCRRNLMECRLNSEVKSRAGSRYCEDMKYDTCCCFGEDAVGRENVTLHYVYRVGTCSRGSCY